MTAKTVSIVPLQNTDTTPIGISEEQLKKRIHLIETSGSMPTIYTGAKAILFTLYLGGNYKWLWWCYKLIPPFRWASEAVYYLVAKNRNRLH